MKLLITPDKQRLQKFCDIVTNFKYLSEFITFNMLSGGIYSQGMSNDHCSIYELTINSEWFDDYEWDASRDLTNLSVSTEFLAKILATRQPSQYLVIEYFGKPDNITVRFASKLKDGKNLEFPKEFSLPLIDVDADQLTIPDLEYDADFGIDSKSLQMTNDQLMLFNETLRIHCSEEEIYMRSKGTDGELKVTLFNDTCEHITEFSIDEDLSLTLDFSNKHFNTFCRFLKVSNNVTLSFKKNFPMKFEYVMESDDINLAFYLAPKISDDDDDDV